MRSSDIDCNFPGSGAEVQSDSDPYCVQHKDSSDSTISLWENSKRRKACLCDLPQSVDNTAEFRAQIDFTQVCEECPSEDGSESDMAEVSIRCDTVDYVNDRLCALQHLLPRGSELEKDEVLKVAIDYVKALEREIQMFDYSRQEWSTCTNAEARNLHLDGSTMAAAGPQSDVGEESGASEGSALQKRGLCVVPLSALAKAF